jgi:hypothetical protein
MPTPFVAPLAAAASSSNVFLYTIIFIFLTGIITTVITKWAKDKCLKFFNRYHITLERTQCQTTWGTFWVFSSGVEIIYDHPYVDIRGRKKTSHMLYQADVDAQLLTLFRYHNELTAEAQQRRLQQVQRTFNPGAFHRFFRKIRNFINTLRDAFNNALGAVVGQYQKMNPSSAVLSTQSGQVTQIGQTLLDKFGNAYEPLLEQYIGQPVILEILDPANPSNVINEFTGYLADYTQNYVAVFNVEHGVVEKFELALPDVDDAPEAPPVAGATPAPAPPPAQVKEENGLGVTIDGPRFKIRNLRGECVVIRQLARQGFEPVNFGAVLPPNGVLDLHTRDARNGTLVIERVQCLDVVAPRKFATVRHAGVLLPRPTLVDEFSISQLPQVPKRQSNTSDSKQ